MSKEIVKFDINVPEEVIREALSDYLSDVVYAELFTGDEFLDVEEVGLDVQGYGINSKDTLTYSCWACISKEENHEG